MAVDGVSKQAWFEVAGADGEKKRVGLEFDPLHVTPPQSAPEFIRTSPLADQAGWVAVDKQTLRHTQFDNVFGIGDWTSTPNNKTAAAVQNQSPVVAANLLAALDGGGEERRYDGYASCPLTTSLGK